MRNKTLALGLGSNLAVPLQNLRLALSEIKQSPLFEVLKLSSIYESDALLPDNAATAWNKKYLNAVVLCKISDEVSAEAILQEIKKIETRLGRAKAERWAPRLIDIDILYWSGANYVAEKLEIPHGALLKRPFALLPLLEVWPDVDLQRPAWARGWSAEIPFNTIKSQMCFWPKMVGILNITTDSFSDGGKYLNPESLQQQLEKLVGDGAEIIDVGAESTRPGALAVPADIEFKNLHWALSEINISVAISLDCRHPEVVARILDAHQLSYLNDVTGFNDPAMQKLLLLSKLPAFIMHSLGVPPTTERVLDVNQNPCSHLTKWWQQQSQNLIELGISPDQLIFDPGIGFGKTQKQNLYILRHLEELSQVHHQVMIGHSRKSFLKYFSDRQAADLDLETALVTHKLNLTYIQYLQIHNIKSQTTALK